MDAIVLAYQMPGRVICFQLQCKQAGCRVQMICVSSRRPGCAIDQVGRTRIRPGGHQTVDEPPGAIQRRACWFTMAAPALLVC